MFYKLVFVILPLECYIVQISRSINIDQYALLHPKLSEDTFGVMAFNDQKMEKRHSRPSYVLACSTICKKGTHHRLIRLPHNLQ